MSEFLIFNYDDYRKFLSDRLEELKKANPRLTVRDIASSAGFGSSSYLKMIINGQRNLSQSSLKKVIEFLGLRPEEATFFRNLVGFNQASNPAEKNLFSQLLVKSRTFRKYQPLAEVQYRFFTHWYYAPIFEILGFKKNGTTSLEKIFQHFDGKPSKPEILAALEDMAKLGLAQKLPNSTWLRLEDSLITGNDITSNFILRFHQEMISHALGAIDSVPWNLRLIQSLTIACRGKDIEQLRELVQQFHDQIVASFSESEGSDVVYQLNVQLFPLTKI